MIDDFWKGRNVLVTGHTGFKGGWLAHTLALLGARVHGFALAPATPDDFYFVTDVQSSLTREQFGDVRDLSAFSRTLKEFEPSIIFHLAAQSLVPQGYVDPIATFDTNVMGTVNVLEAIRHTNSVSTLINVTSDKVYENTGLKKRFMEGDRLGGDDPYSASKACAEIVTEAYYKSYMAEGDVCVATARAGNVIGGGDWALDRIVPDYFRAHMSKKSLSLRFPEAVRPWQHVLDPVHGYIKLAEHLLENGSQEHSSWNFGPRETGSSSVRDLVALLNKTVNSPVEILVNEQSVFAEAFFLQLDCTKSQTELGWSPRWGLADTVMHTAKWYEEYNNTRDMNLFTLQQIQEFFL